MTDKYQEIINLLESGLTPRDIALQRGVSHQAIESYLQRQGFDYRALLERRRAEVVERKRIARIKFCRICNRAYSLDEPGARYRFCSLACYQKDNRRWHRDWARKHRQSDRRSNG